MRLPLPVLLVSLALRAGCDKLPSLFRQGSAPPQRRIDLEHVDEAERTAATQLVPIQGPVSAEIDAYVAKIRNDFLTDGMDSLETEAAALRAAKPVFANGSWKIVPFYSAFTPISQVPEPVWEQFVSRFRKWLQAHPESVTARIAYADFLMEYAWHARGTGYADTVTEEGWSKMRQRLEDALDLLAEARELPEEDPCWFLTALTVALGQGWSEEDYEALLADAHAAEPKFWGYDAARAAFLATMAEDQPYAKARFDELGDRYLPDVWPLPESFAQ